MQKKFSCKDNESLYRVIEAFEDIEKAKFPIEIFDKDKKELIRTIHCPSEMPNLDFLKDIDIDLLNPCQNEGKKANQKWHLFVGIFAYNVVFKSKFEFKKYFPLNYKCLILRLWMIENAEKQKEDLNDIETAIDNGNTNVNSLINKAFDSYLRG